MSVLFLGVLLYALHSAEFAESIDLATLDGTENAVSKSLVSAVKVGEELIHLGTLGVAVGGTG